MCVYVCVCVCVCICMRMFMCVCVCACVCRYVCTYEKTKSKYNKLFLLTYHCTYIQGKGGKDITIGIASNQKAMDVFKEVVLRVWRASNSPDAIQDKLCPDESIEMQYIREMRIRDMLGLPRPFGVNGEKTLNLTGTHSGLKGGALGQSGTHTPSGAGGLGLRNSLNVSSSISLAGLFGRSLTTRNLAIENGDNVLNTTVSNGNTPLTKSASTSRLDQVPLGDQLHTPFNARELMWNAQSNL